MPQPTTVRPVVSSVRTPWSSLLILALAVFATVTVEMIPAGLLPAMSAEFSVSAPAVGMLVSLWALTVIVVSLPVVRLTERVDRRTLLVVALGVMSVANVMTALAPDYWITLAFRIVAAVAHGAFWSVVMVYATSLVPPRISGRTIAIVSAGASGATVVGVPLGTYIGQAADWRFVFAGLAVVLGLLAVGIWRHLPAAAGSSARRSRRVDRSIWPVLAAAIACTFTGAATFTVFTYISPFLTDVAGLRPASISVVLLVFGGAGVFGLVVAAVTADRRPVVSLVAMAVLLAAAMAALGIAPASTPVAVTGTFVWGLAIGGLPAMLQARMLAVASPALRGTASAMMVVFFNGGIATGALLGAILEQSVGLAATAPAASILAVFAIASIVASRMLAGR